jgi:hypothetical protein
MSFRVIGVVLNNEVQEKTYDFEIKNINMSQAYSSNNEHVKHIDFEHPGKIYYPTPEDFEKRLL